MKAPLQRFVVRQLIGGLLTAVLACLLLFGYGVWRSHSLTYDYLLWNLFLAGLPLLFAIRLTKVLTIQRWSAWQPLLWTFLWLLFVPNSFYMISDYIHLRTVSADTILYEAVMFTSFILLGVILGFASLYLVHYELRRRLKPLAAAAWVAAIILICSVAIYIGRDLRWNSWDVITNPGGLLFDLSDRLLRPDAYPDMLLTIVDFSVLIGSLYTIFWKLARILRAIGAREAAAYLRTRQQ